MGLIVLISGFCSLAYQVVWLREFRLVFGGATPAASAVLAVFMGALGIGGAILGKRVEKSTTPGRFYAFVEGGITLSALLTPLLLALVRFLYTQSGGIQALGLLNATLIQILMTVIVIGPSCFLMGGTLPASLKIVQSNADSNRATTAVFYGLNVTGAVLGAFFATFIMLPVGGNLLTLFTAGFANAIIALITFMILRNDVRPNGDLPIETRAQEPIEKGIAPAWFISAAAFTSGFVFFVIELVWYRASIPLFGGSVYNFGLILTMALAGIGLGSLFYSFLLQRMKPSLGAFAAVSGLLALGIIIPFALGDSLAHLALLLNTFFRPRSFEGLIIGWSIVCAILVFLPAFFSGIQFPLMMSLLGRGGDDIGNQIGRTYAWNTFGAVSGALLGGFFLIPHLSITGSWRLVALIAALLSIASLSLRLFKRTSNGRGGLSSTSLAFITCSLAAVVAIFSAGPSSYWLHHPIGYGRANPQFGSSKIDWLNYVREVNRTIFSSKDGLETSVAVYCIDEFGLLSNGKSDGSALSDGPTVAMLGLVGAALHPTKVENACIVGFGTGITAGWLNQVDSVKRVDVIELEQAVIDLSSPFQTVNFHALDSPKNHVIQGDAREVLVTRPDTYDLIVSEPSNLHRAGVANLYTHEFYQSVAARMNSGAIFCQWVQAYETDFTSIQLVVATLRSVFPKVELWQTLSSDLLLVCSLDPSPWNLDLLDQRLRTEPFLTASRNLWVTTSVEGFLSRTIGNADFATRIAKDATTINTDDRNLLEFAFGRNVGALNSLVIPDLLKMANEHRELIPHFTSKKTSFDVNQWASEYLWKSVTFRMSDFLPSPPTGINAWPEKITKEAAFIQSMPTLTPQQLIANWPTPPTTEASRTTRIRQLAKANHPDAQAEIEIIRKTWPVESIIMLAEQAEAKRNYLEAIELYFNALSLAQTNHLIRPSFPKQAWDSLNRLLPTHPPISQENSIRYFNIAATPLCFGSITDKQRHVLTELSNHLPLEYKVRAAMSWGDFPPLDSKILRFREEAFRKASHPEHARALADLTLCPE